VLHGAGKLWCIVDLAGVAGAAFWEACLRVIQTCACGGPTPARAALVSLPVTTERVPILSSGCVWGVWG
jgi:hypothetical protein